MGGKFGRLIRISIGPGQEVGGQITEREGDRQGIVGPRETDDAAYARTQNQRRNEPIPAQPRGFDEAAGVEGWFGLPGAAAGAGSWFRRDWLGRDGRLNGARARLNDDGFNRLALGEDLEALAARALRYGHKYCAALCDVDEFKAYNDHFGHLSGDEVLRRTARAIRGELRRGDVFYRYGGEEFLVILPEQSLAEAALGLNRVRQAIYDLAIPHAPSAGSPFVTISAGVSSMRTAPVESIDGWLRRTDAALYLAKSRGRNQVALEE